MVRNIIAGVLGIVVAWILFTLIQAGSHLVFPPEVPLNTNDLESIKRYMETITPAMFAVVLAGYAIGSFGGGFVIGKVAESKKNTIPIIVGGLLTIGWILNLIMLPHPIWVAVVGFLMYIPFTILGKNVAVKPGAGTDDEAEEDAGDDVLSAAGTGVGAAVAGSAVAEAGSAVTQEDETGSVGGAGGEVSADDSGFVADAGGELSDGGADSDAGSDTDSYD